MCFVRLTLVEDAMAGLRQGGWVVVLMAGKGAGGTRAFFVLIIFKKIKHPSDIFNLISGEVPHLYRRWDESGFLMLHMKYNCFFWIPRVPALTD